MKLISCYIENFGGLKEYSVSFDEGMTVINRPNGFGKTTLAAFIRTMFYGFPRAAKAMGKNDRKKYLPWQGGRCGGNIVFSVGQDTYRVERFFGSAPKQDTFSLYKLNPLRESKDFSENLGSELFGIDAESFERSTYMPQSRDFPTLSTTGIQAKLGNLVEDTSDINNLASAASRLKSERAKLVAWRGEGGAVAEAQRRINELEEKCAQIRRKSQELCVLSDQINAVRQSVEQNSAQLDDVRKRISVASQAAVRAELDRQYRELEKEKQELQARLTQFNTLHPNGLPEQKVSDEIYDGIDELERLFAAQEKSESLLNAEKTAQEWKSRFEKAPTEEEFSSCRLMLDELTADKAQLDSVGVTEEDQLALEKLKNVFKNGVPSAGTIAENSRLLSEADALRRESSQLVLAEEKNGKSKAAIAAMAIGALMVAASVVLFILKSFPVGGALLGIGVISLIGGVYLSISKMAAHRTNGAQKYMLEANERKIAVCQERVRGFVSEFYTDIDNLHESLGRLKSDAERYADLEKKSADAKDRRARLEVGIKEKREAVEDFLLRYFGGVTEENYAQLLTQLQLDYRAFVEAQRLLDEHSRANEARKNRTAELSENICEFFKSFPELSRDRAGRSALSDELAKQREISERIKENNLKLSDFLSRNSNQLKTPLCTEITDIEALRTEESDLVLQLNDRNAELIELNQRYNEIKDAVDFLPELEDELIRLKEQKNADLKKKELLEKTVEFLTTAEESLSTRYLGDIKERFVFYLGKLSEETGDTVFINRNMEISIERSGAARELGYFSMGYSDLITFCMRLALVDALFKDEKPFIILDDPFVNLDDANTDKALKLLKNLGKERQIIYFVCNSSRC